MESQTIAKARMPAFLWPHRGGLRLGGCVAPALWTVPEGTIRVRWLLLFSG